jgi:hypothetical protein
VAANPLYARCVERAAQLLGGYGELANEVGASVRQLEAWARGEATPPTAVFLQIIDIVLDGEPPPGAAPPRRAAPPAKRGK